MELKARRLERLLPRRGTEETYLAIRIEGDNEDRKTVYDLSRKFDVEELAQRVNQILRNLEMEMANGKANI